MARKVPPLKFDPFISKVSLSNFKSVVDQEVDLGRLTLLVGENSSGKSSILQVLRLLQQSLQSESVGDRFPLNGDLIRMGTIKDIRTAQKNLGESDVFFGVEVVYDPSTMRPDFRTSMHPDKRNSMIVNWGINISDTVPDEPGSTYIKGLRVMCFNSEQKSQLFLDVKRRGNSNITPIYYGSGSRSLRWNRRSFFYRGLEADLAFKGTISSKSSESVIVSGLTLMGSFPLSVTVKKLANRVLTEEWLNRTIEKTERFELQNRRLRLEERRDKSRELFIRKDELSDEFSLVDFAVEHINNLLEKLGPNVPPENLFSKVPVLKKELLQIVNSSNQREKIIKAISRNLIITSKRIDIFEHNVSEEDIGFPYIREIIGRIRYLGPLREAPQFVMLTSPTSSTGNIGSKGEFTAAVLRFLGGQKLSVPIPRIPKFKNNSVVRISLIEAIKVWSAYLGLVEDIHIEDLAALGLTIKVKPHGVGSALSLPSVGVGVSQLLPVLVVCLLAEPGSVILLEQPELHLHPALQQRLADFFIAISRSGRQLIVETHSEYIISRLRRRIAEDADDDLMKLVKVIFAERDRKTGETKYRDLDLTPYGDIEEWPKGFFDQAAEDEREIIRGALAKRKARKSSDLSEGG